MKMKSLLSVLLALLMVFTITTPVFAATKPATKTITFNAGTHYDNESLNSDATIKVTNVTSQKTKDFSAKLHDDDGNLVTIEGKNSKVIYCKGKTTVTLKPNKGEKTAQVFGMPMYYDAKTVKTVEVKVAYYEFNWETEEVGKKLDKKPDHDDWVVGDGTTHIITKPGTYVLYVRPLLFYGIQDEDFKLNPVFIVVKK